MAVFWRILAVLLILVPHAQAAAPGAVPSAKPNAKSSATPALKSFYAAPAQVPVRPRRGVPLKAKSKAHTQHLDFDGYAKTAPKRKSR